MAAYKDLVGQKITKVTSNPGEPKTGQMWYNSTSGTLRGLGVVKAFSSASPLISARSDFRGTFGTQSAFKGAGGFNPPPGNAITDVEDYDGTGFTSAAVLPLATRNQGGGGTQTAGWVAGGRRYPESPSNQTNKTQEWDGSSWSEGGDLGASKYGNSGTGTLTAGLVSGGFDNAAPGNLNQTEEYNGSSWSEQNNMGTARYRTAATGTQTATILFGGVTYPGSPQKVNNVEEYDGTSWTALTNLPAVNGMAYSFGTTTNALVTGGASGPGPAVNTTLQWDGTSYTSFPNLATARYNGGDGASTSSTAGIVVGGYVTNALATTEEYNQSTNTITAAAWTSGGTYPYAAANVVSLGPATAMLSCGGNNSGPTKQTTVTLYNGTSYSAETAMPAAANGMGQGKGGTETAGLVFGGNNPGSNTATDTILYNGSSWTSGGALSTGRRNLGGLGISTAALAFGGQTPSYTDATEEYGGSSWTAGGALPAARRNATGVGSQTAGLVLAGQSPPGVGVNTSFTYNGTSYSGGPTMINNRSDAAASGPNSSNTSALVYGGSAGAPPYTVLLPTETYDGSSFSTAPSLSTGRDGAGSGASSTEGVQVGGYVPSGSYSSATEQFTPESTAANITDFTTS